VALTLTSLSQVAALGFDDIIDVRAPAEWAEDHIPGAISLPVLDDAERARVGTIYKRESPFRARKVGAALVEVPATALREQQILVEEEVVEAGVDESTGMLECRMFVL
jgi:tRNA 2-selenouridine synthase